jgi:DNA-binding transcriptional LysR family regulator
MELAWIEDFLALAHTQNFTHAAAQRCTTQPAFSRRVRLLEEWLGVTLFQREMRPVQLTPSGEEFLRRAQRMREDILDARRIAMSSKSYYPKALRIYSTTAIAVGILPKWFKKTGDVNFSILTSSTGGCLEALRQKRADQIFLPWFASDVEDSQLRYKKIADDNLMLIESAHTDKRLAFKDKTLRGALMMYAPGTIFGQQIAAYMEKIKVVHDGDIMCESSSAETLLAFAKQGQGAAWVSQSLMDQNVRRCDVPKKLDVSCAIMMVTRAD